MADQPALRVNDLKTYFRTPYGTARAVDGISFDIRKGETFALVGESGCGKSVTALSVMQLVPQPAGYHAGGEIWIGDTDITTLSETRKRDIRGRNVSMIFQDPMTSLNPVLTVGFQIAESVLRHEQMSKKAAWDKAGELLHSVNIPDAAQRLTEYPHQLSGGMKQRVMIAMALSSEPDVLIADEPTTALDVTVQAQILDLIAELQSRIGMAVLLITHDLGIVREHADEVAVMYAGKIAERATKQDLFANPSHPYTRALFRSLPSMQKRGTQLAAIRGIVPNATEFPDGCRFADRCGFVMDSCRASDPPAYQIGETHTATCVLYDPESSHQPPTDDLEPSVVDPERAPSETSTPIIEVRDLQTWFPIRKGILKKTVGHVRAVDGVTLAIPRGKTLAVVGESGCGKTTLGKSLLRLVEPSGGEVLFDGNKITGESKAHLNRIRRNIQLIFQDPYSSLNPRMMVREIIEEGMLAQKVGGATADARTQRIEEIMGLVGLDPSMMSRYPHEFSGGQRQRIAIARALAVEPQFIVCDEPTSALDVSVQAQILNLLKRLQRELGLSYLFITHDLSVVEYLADEVAVMYLGRIVERGTTEEVFRSPKHPYTKALLSAVPKVDDIGIAKIRLEGDVPSPVNPPSGCHFHPRCPEAFAPCSGEYPGAATFSETHSCRCYLHIEPPSGN
ncbi:MAG: dipeptide ABC transporter ATP-binding protein [Candidatus Poribacteria bacterium]|nr:dipeptide ABC transporter ATP-binding protein [Candidatus Poribacteria bacterium]